MDLIDYERAKFELAAILRSAGATLTKARPDVVMPFSDLFARLAEDRFNLAVIGRFSRGKSSLMNAMLHTDRLPTGILPLTSVITTVSYGSIEQVFIEHEGWTLQEEVALDALPNYVTQQGNPGNRKRVRFAHVKLPAELLRRGFHFVDTPGLGSAIVANTRTTERFLPQVDAFMLVTGFAVRSPRRRSESSMTPQRQEGASSSFSTSAIWPANRNNGRPSAMWRSRPHVRASRRCRYFRYRRRRRWMRSIATIVRYGWQAACPS